MEKAICFGAAGGGKRLFDEISEKYEIIAFTDNDKDKKNRNEYKWNKDLWY